MFKLFITLVASFFICTTAHAFHDSEITGKINDLINKKLPGSHIGIVLQEASTGKLIYSHNADQLFVPASTLKLLTGAAALIELGRDFQFKTVLKAEQKISGNAVMDGNIYIQFNGDPSLTDKDLDGLISQLAKKNIKEIKGDIILDHQLYNGPDVAPGWSQEDLWWYFAAPVTSAIINENKFDIFINPSDKLGEKTEVNYYIGQSGLKLTSDLTTVTLKQSENECQLDIINLTNMHLHLQGCWSIDYKNYHGYLALQKPLFYVKKIIAKSLAKYNIKHSGKIKLTGEIPEDSYIFATHKSEKLLILLTKILSESNNIYSDSFLKMLGARLYGKGSFKTGVLAVKRILKEKIGFNSDSLYFVDGSGNSRYNLISPSDLARILYLMNHDLLYKDLYQNALALSGKEGTLKKRLNSFNLYKKVAAKTGSMSDVSGLAGYLTTRKGHKIIIAILTNHSLQSRKEKKLFEEELLYFIANEI